MNYDEFSFFNHQLAAMLREGIPLEGALKQLSAGMRSAALRGEIERLEADLAAGVSLEEALGRRKLPPLYVGLVQIGARSNDLPGTLTMVADYYQRLNSVWTRLKGLMVYPVIVVLVSLLCTLCLSLLMSSIIPQIATVGQRPPPQAILFSIWIPSLALGGIIIAGVCGLWVNALRSWLRWHLPAFRDASLARLASSISMMLHGGMTLSDALALAQTLETGTAAGQVLGRWRVAVESGRGSPAGWTEPARPFPPFFLWLVRTGGQDLEAGFQKAAEVYEARAGYRIELALYGALPVSIVLLGSMILWQVVPVMWTFNYFSNAFFTY
jgi:type IV pilus assembly protein PilC